MSDLVFALLILAPFGWWVPVAAWREATETLRDRRQRRTTAARALAARLRDLEKAGHEADQRAWQAEYDTLCDATDPFTIAYRAAQAEAIQTGKPSLIRPASCEQGNHVWALCRADCVICGTRRERGAA